MNNCDTMFLQGQVPVAHIGCEFKSTRNVQHDEMTDVIGGCIRRTPMKLALLEALILFGALKDSTVRGLP